MAKKGRPFENGWGKNKSRDPNRRRIQTKTDLSGLTAEEKKAHIKAESKKYTQRIKEEEKRLEYLKEPAILLTRDSEPYDVFLKRVKKKNSDRLTEILNDPELVWKIFADRDDITTVELYELREKKKEKKKYITNNEIDEIMNEIYGGIKRKKVYEEDEEEYHNPYEQSEE
jgi:hypothetical protein